nr:HAD family hydrolase [Butyrivibrio sp.]
YRKKGVVYTATSIHEDYLKLVHKEEMELAKATGFEYPEIRLEKVFAGLYNEGFKSNSVSLSQTISEEDPWIQEIAVSFRETSRSKLFLFPATVKTLKTLRSRGAKVYLLSNAQHCFTEPEMKEVGLWDMFDDIFISSDHGKKKPQPEFMEELITKHNIDRKNAVMVGNDFTSDIRIALSCGMESIFLNTDKHSAENMQKLLLKERELTSSNKNVSIIESGNIAEIL